MRNQFVKSTNGNGTVVVRRTAKGEETSSGPLTTVPQELISSRAYELWQQRGRVHGHDQQDWFQAERELCTEMKAPSLVASVKR